MKILTVYYSVNDGGDGSAYPRFMESEELTEWDQENMEEGCGEPCTGSISFQSESDIIPLFNIITKEEYLITHYFENDKRDDFIKQFFPNGLPTFRVETEIVNHNDNYLYNNVFVDDRKIARIFKRKEQSGEVFENYLNNNN